MIKNKILVTPSFTEAVLESITRDSIIIIARSLGYEVIERPVDRSELYTADEAFLCGSAMELTPVLSIDKYKLGNGEISRELHKAYVDVARGLNKDFRDWLTVIY